MTMTMMRRRHLRSIPTAALAACVVATACGGDDDRPTTVDLTAPVRIDVTPIPGSALTSTLSGDGRLVAYATADGVCVVEIASGTERCTDPGASPWSESIRFAPDSSQLVFVDDYIRQLAEPDVRVLDITTMQVVNLTDDGVDAVGLGGDGPTGLIDLAPTWLPDGSIVYVRSAGPGSAPVLMRWAPDQEPSVVSDLPGIDAGELAFPLEPVGPAAVLGITFPVSGDADMIRVDLESGGVETIARFDESDGHVQLVSVSPDTGVALVAYAEAIGMGRDDRPLHALVDLESGVVRPLLDGVGDGDGNPLRTSTAVLTPDGTGIVFGRAGFDRLGVYTVTTEAAVGAVGLGDIERIGSLPEELDGDELLGWHPAVRMVWTDDGRLVGRAGLTANATVTFGDPG